MRRVVAAGQGHRLRLDDLGDPVADGQRVAVALHAVEEDDELVTAEAGDQVVGSQDRADALGDLAEQVVADVVAAGVVDQLEAVDVEEEEGDVGAVPTGPGQCLFEVVEELRPVGQAGERVVQGPVGPSRLDLAAVGHVPGETAELAEVAVFVPFGPQGHLDEDRVPTPAPHGELARPAPLPLDPGQDLGVEAA